MNRRLKTTETSFEIIDLLWELDGATISALSDRLDLAKSTIHGHLKTLESNRLVVKEANEYHLGVRFFQYGEFTRRRKPEYEIARQYVDRIAEQSQEGTNFCVAEHGKIMVLFGASMPDDPVYDIGEFFAMHNTAVGKAILAELPEDRVEEVIDRWGLPEHTENTITTRRALLEELETVRQRGYAYNRAELLPGLNSVGTAVKRPDESVVGALSVGGPAYRIRGQRLEEDLTDLLMETKREFETEVASIYLPD